MWENYVLGSSLEIDFFLFVEGNGFCIGFYLIWGEAVLCFSCLPSVTPLPKGTRTQWDFWSGAHFRVWSAWFGEMPRWTPTPRPCLMLDKASHGWSSLWYSFASPVHWGLIGADATSGHSLGFAPHKHHGCSQYFVSSQIIVISVVYMCECALDF